jgi:hypothetical protein
MTKRITIRPPKPPPWDVLLTVSKFRNPVAGSGCAAALTDHDIAVGTPPGPEYLLHVGTFQKNLKVPQTLRVMCSGAVLRFIVEGPKGDPEKYQPIGIAFARADGTKPAAAPWIAGSRALMNSPFSVIGFQPGVLEVENIPIKDLQGLTPAGKIQVPKPDFITYKFSVIIQRQSDGAIGIIDPYIENEN